MSNYSVLGPLGGPKGPSLLWFQGLPSKNGTLANSVQGPVVTQVSPNGP